MLVPRDQLVEWLNGIAWRSVAELSGVAEWSAFEHLEGIRAVLDHLSILKRLTRMDAYGYAQTAGHSSPQGRTLIDDLFAHAALAGTGARNEIVGNVVAAHWQLDEDLFDLPNPWSPILALYDLGYTTSGTDDEETDTITFIVVYRGGEKGHRI